ncbi:MAG TPA: hypothetical protein VL866_04015 [Pyrinomonadaceae bacterium]|nr:hypothetical protein [Pyrinomonadaceae bacterium]
MNTRTSKSLTRQMLAITISLTLFAVPVCAQGQGQKPSIKTDTKIVYHNGPVMQGQANVYLIWYGNFAGTTTPTILTDLVSNVGGTPYFVINAMYRDANGTGPSGGAFYSGTVSDSYSHGATLTPSDMQEVVRDFITNGNLPLDNNGIYVILASPDVTDIYPDGTTFCLRPFPHHGSFTFNGASLKYGFVGNADRCGHQNVAPWFFTPNGTELPTPNDNFGADVMASTLAHLLSVTVTNPTGSAWFDRYGFENAAKCYGTFGETYPSSNGGPANIRLGQRDYMLQQNWVNARKAFCAMGAPQP